MALMTRRKQLKLNDPGCSFSLREQQARKDILIKVQVGRDRYFKHIRVGGAILGGAQAYIQKDCNCSYMCCVAVLCCCHFWPVYVSARRVQQISPQTTMLAHTNTFTHPPTSVKISCPDPAMNRTCPLYIALLMSFGGAYTSSGVVPRVQVALDHINSDPRILPGYTLHYTLKDSQVSEGDIWLLQYW